jgi:ArsR family transcriptional regulator, arsenate/arsenite/antimonite-responsive transcriptional repressor
MVPLKVVDATPGPSRGDCCLPRRIAPRDRALAAQVADVARLLADPIRVQVLDLLREADGEVCQCDLQPLFDVSQPTMSHHLKKLREGGVVDVERRGKWAYYSINDEALEVLRSWLS